jgi:type IV pilus assembly protein PilC
MAEFRYQGITVNGKPFQGVVFATNQIEAKRRIGELATTHGLRIRAIHKRVPFLYKVRRTGNKKALKGEIFAYTVDEVRESLERMGYEIVQIQRNYLHFKLPVPEKDVAVFIRLCADLLREKYPYDEILTLLSNDIENRTLRETIMEIHKDLKQGKEGHQVYLKHAHTLGKFTTHMLSIASTSGSMADIYDSTAKFLDRSADLKKNIRSVLFMPAIVLFASIGALVFYVAYIFPEIAGMLLKYDIGVPPMTAATLAASDMLLNNIGWLIPATILPLIAAAFFFFNTLKGQILRDRFVLKIPVVGKLLHRNSIEVFARVFHTLYSSSGENVEAIKVAAEACRNSFIEKQVKERVIPMMLREGRSFSDALESTRVFPKNAIYALRSGEESGTLRDATARLANFYEKETTHKLTRVIDLINLIITVFVSLLIVGITLLSTEIGFISTPPSPIH